MDILTVGPTGEIELPNTERGATGITPATPVRIVETRNGILLIPMGRASQSGAGRRLAQWQALTRRLGRCFPTRRKT